MEQVLNLVFYIIVIAGFLPITFSLFKHDGKNYKTYAFITFCLITIVFATLWIFTEFTEVPIIEKIMLISAGIIFVLSWLAGSIGIIIYGIESIRRKTTLEIFFGIISILVGIQMILIEINLLVITLCTGGQFCNTLSANYTYVFSVIGKILEPIGKLLK